MVIVDCGEYLFVVHGDFTIHHLEGGVRIAFFFDPGGGDGGVVLEANPTICSEGVTAEDVSRALERIEGHLKSVGYDVIIAS